MSVEFIDRGLMDTRRQAYTLNEDSLAGFKAAVNNGQTRLALEYAERLIDSLLSRVSALEVSSQNISNKEDETVEAKEKVQRPRKQNQDKENIQEA